MTLLEMNALLEMNPALIVLIGNSPLLLLLTYAAAARVINRLTNRGN